MKALIRPFLFTVARLGLFLAVVAWIVGQWWEAHLSTSHMSAAVCPYGCVFVRRNVPYYPVDIEFQRITGKSRGTYGALPITQEEADKKWGSSPSYTVKNLAFPGMFFQRHYGVIGGGAQRSGFLLAIRHSILASLLLITNLLLHFIYRKRPEAEPCED